MAKHKGDCDESVANVLTFTNDVTAKVDVVNVGDCRVRVRFLKNGAVESEGVVEPCDWTDPPLEDFAIREVELFCRDPDDLDARDPRCRFSYAVTATGRYRGRCRDPDEPLRPRLELKKPLDVTVTAKNNGQCDVHIRLMARKPPNPMLPIGPDVVVKPGDRVVTKGKDVLIAAIVCFGDKEDLCRIAYEIEAR